jgi:hypothetical protein
MMKLHLLHSPRCFFNSAERKVVDAEKIHRVLAVGFLLFSVCGLSPALAHHPFDIELKVWSSQSFDDPFCSDDPIDVYFRVNRTAYLTVYQINPCGGVEILYPLACHRWMPVQPGRTYHLTDLAAELDLFYGGAEGNAYIGIVATDRPIDIVPWLEAGFRDHGLIFGRPQRTVSVDFRLVIDRVLADVRVRLGSACAPTYYLAPIYVRPRVVVHRPPVIWPTPPRHKSYPPKWIPNRDDDYPSSQPEPPEKRPFRRRSSFPLHKTNENQSDMRYKMPDSGKHEAPERSYPDKRSDKRVDEVKVKNDSKGSGSGAPSKGTERRVKKPRN